MSWKLDEGMKHPGQWRHGIWVQLLHFKATETKIQSDDDLHRLTKQAVQISGGLPRPTLCSLSTVNPNAICTGFYWFAKWNWDMCNGYDWMLRLAQKPLRFFTPTNISLSLGLPRQSEACAWTSLVHSTDLFSSDVSQFTRGNLNKIKYDNPVSQSYHQCSSYCGKTIGTIDCGTFPISWKVLLDRGAYSQGTYLCTFWGTDFRPGQKCLPAWQLRREGCLWEHPDFFPYMEP